LFEIRIIDRGLVRDIALAAGTVAVISGLRLLLEPVLYDRAAFLLFGLGVMVGAWWGGPRLGLLTTIFGGIAGVILFVKPFPESVGHHFQDETQIALFAVEGLGITFFAGQLHTARSNAEQEAANANRFRSEIAELVESVREGFQAFDSGFRLTFMNRAAEQMLGRTAAELVGKTIWEEFPGLDADVEQMLRRLMKDRTPDSCETWYAPWQRWLRFQAYPFRDGLSVLFSDITVRQNAQAERERLIGELQVALGNVRTLRGLIPICAWCKNIRNDQGYWEQLELYLKDHSEADFSHGMCPECARKFRQT